MDLLTVVNTDESILLKKEKIMERIGEGDGQKEKVWRYLLMITLIT